MAKVLIIDNSNVMRLMLEGMFTNLGYEVVGLAKDGLDGISKFEKLKPDLVSMELNMPQLDGLAASKRILDTYPDAKILMISNIDDKRIAQDVIGQGPLDYLYKPISFEDLRERISFLNV